MCLSFLPTKPTSNDMQGIGQQCGHIQTALASNPLGHCQENLDTKDPTKWNLSKRKNYTYFSSRKRKKKACLGHEALKLWCTFWVNIISSEFRCDHLLFCNFYIFINLFFFLFFTDWYSEIWMFVKTGNINLEKTNS